MPVRAEDQHWYEGEKWQAVRRQVLARAKDACECGGECGRHGGASNGYRCGRANRSDYRNANGHLVRVLLEIAHTDHDPSHQDPARLRAYCQECHLLYDRMHHLRNATATRRAALKNLELFE